MSQLDSWWPTDADYKEEYDTFSRLNPKGLTGATAATAFEVDDSDDDEAAAPKKLARNRRGQVKGEDNSDVEMVDVPAAGPSKKKKVGVELRARPVAGRAGDHFGAFVTPFV